MKVFTERKPVMLNLIEINRLQEILQGYILDFPEDEEVAVLFERLKHD